MLLPSFLSNHVNTFSSDWRYFALSIVLLCILVAQASAAISRYYNVLCSEIFAARSKTEVIRWHKVPKIRFFAVISIWIAACVVYLIDYGLGLTFLFFLSFTHVLLEFPLNMMSIVGIGKESISIVKGGFSRKSQ